MMRSLRIRYFKKISQQLAPTPDTGAPKVQVQPQTQPQQDARTLQGVNSYLFGAQSWTYINHLISEINNSLFMLSKGKKLGGQSMNFLTVVKNPSASTSYTGGLKNLFNLSLSIWPLITIDKQGQVYTTAEAKQIAASLLAKINAYSFPEPEATNIKSNLVTIINNWVAVLNSSV